MLILFMTHLTFFFLVMVESHAKKNFDQPRQPITTYTEQFQCGQFIINQTRNIRSD